MIIEQSEQIIREVSKAFTGKDEIIRKVLMTIYAGGHILLEDCPGVGKQRWPWLFPKRWGWIINEFSLRRTRCPPISPVSACSTARRINLNTVKARLPATFC